MKKKILIVDDEPDMRIFVSTVVKTGGYFPVAAEDGISGLKAAESEQPDLVILDVMMPRIEDGIKTYHAFRTHKTLADTPVLMLSAIARKTFFHSLKMLTPESDRDIREPEAYMEKPPDADELLHLVNRCLEER
jgi:two-component system, OmpR family, phosphate regulon response regulator PhoB